VFPSFAKAAWLGIVPEFNPFKYNSFPVNAARQSSLVARTLQRQILGHARAGRLVELPPILTFQSVVDFTVSTQAVVSALYDHLPANGSELVLIDINRNAIFGPFLREGAEGKLDRLLPEAPRTWRAAIVTNAAPDRFDVVERALDAGARDERTRELGLAYPPDVFSLSHIALPFPIDDPLYGMSPDPAESFGARLGSMALRGERGTLIVASETFTRMSSNRSPYLLARRQGHRAGAKRPDAAGLPCFGIDDRLHEVERASDTRRETVGGGVTLLLANGPWRRRPAHGPTGNGLDARRRPKRGNAVRRVLRCPLRDRAAEARGRHELGHPVRARDCRTVGRGDRRAGEA
jgi:hypothetical protein